MSRLEQETGKGYYLVSYTDLMGGHRTQQVRGYGIVEAVEGFLAEYSVWNIQSVVRIAEPKERP
jgi:hypothetical protein